MGIKGKAQKVVENRKQLLLICNCIESILDVFDSSKNLDTLIWQVDLVRDPSSQTVQCYVAFGLESDSIHFNKEDLLTDKYIKMTETNPIILAIEKLNYIINIDKYLIFSVKEYLEKNALENFDVEYKNNSLTIKMNKKVICEKQESEE